MLGFPTVDTELVKEIEWTGDSAAYDIALKALSDEDWFFVLNPWATDKDIHHHIEDIPDVDNAVVWVHDGEWIAKLFHCNWKPADGFKEVILDRPSFIWRKNPDLDRTMTFIDDPFAKYQPDPWESKRELVWFIDSRFNPLEDRVWAIKCIPAGVPIKGLKEMGELTPDVNIVYNPELPQLDIDIDDLCPPYYDLANENAYKLDPVHSPFEDMWVLKFIPAYRKPKPLIWIGTITPTVKVKKNKELPGLEYDLAYDIPASDLDYEHVWMLDEKHTKNAVEPIWAVKMSAVKKPKGTKIVGSVSPKLNIEFNPECKGMFFKPIDYEIQHHDFEFNHVWMLPEDYCGQWHTWAVKISVTKFVKGDKFIGEVVPESETVYNPDLAHLKLNVFYEIPYYDKDFVHVWYLDYKAAGNEMIWAAKMIAGSEASGEKVMGYVVPQLTDQIDVVFISYKEANAEENWARVLEKAPWAKRVKNVTGIFEAHKKAAELATTDVFYVVDGDAYLDDKWKFDYNPDLFERDCTFIWHSRNPLTGTHYGYGGVKLFPRKRLLEADSWNTLDLSTSTCPNIKVINKISNTTAFNTDEMSVWRSAFRECVKLCHNMQEEPKNKQHSQRLQKWLTIDPALEFGECAVDGATNAVTFYNMFKHLPKKLQAINDRKWLEKRFKDFYKPKQGK
jgi:hypothetical protein